MPKLTQHPIKATLMYADPWKDIVKDAWLASRPNLTDTNVNYEEVLKIDTPVTELPGVVLQLEVPILFREIMCTPRDHIVWARTSRIENLEEEWKLVAGLIIPEIDKINDLSNSMMKSKNEGNIQDKFRESLPLSYMTGLTVRFSLRGLLKMTAYFEYLFLKYPYISLQALQMYNTLHDVLSELGVPTAVIKSTKVIKFCPEDVSNVDVSNEGQSYQDANVTVGIVAPIMLRAQVVRHRPLCISDNLADLFNNPNVWSTPVSSTVNMVISATKSVWKMIIGKRGCHLSHNDLWVPLCNKVLSTFYDTSATLKEVIPCSNGKCPYAGDAVGRLLKKDPGIPCPIHCCISGDPELDLLCQNFNTDTTSVDNVFVKMKEYAKLSERPVEFWNYWVDQLVDQYNKYTNKETKSNG